MRDSDWQKSPNWCLFSLVRVDLVFKWTNGLVALLNYAVCMTTAEHALAVEGGTFYICSRWSCIH